MTRHDEGDRTRRETGGTDRSRPSRVSRRAMLAASVASGAALVTPVRGAGAGPNPMAARPDATRYLQDPDMNAQTLFAFGAAGYGAAEFGEVATVVNRINARGENYDTFFDEFSAMGRQLRGQGDAALAKGHRASARGAYLRAATYLGQALFVVPGTKDPYREGSEYGLMEASWRRAAALFSPPFERVAIPYGGTHLPGFFLKADRSDRPRPTVILNNGSDAQNVDLYVYGGAAALERGYHALIFEGPGQGAMLFQRGVPFRPDWEKVVTPVVDYLRARADVDRSRVAIIGWSFAGLLVARAAAFEHRLAAVCLDPGFVDYIRAWHLPPELAALVRAGRREAVNQEFSGYLQQASPQARFTIAKRGEIFGKLDYYDLIRTIERYTCAAYAGRITAPTLVTQAELEQAFPGQAQEVYDLIKAPKQLVTFTVAEGAQFHDSPMAPQRRNAVIFDWLDETLKV